jgi:two-component system response regulator HydG
MNRDAIPTVLADVVDSMHDGLFLVAPDGTILMVNEALTRLTGYAREELEGQPCTVLGCDQCAQQRLHCGDHWCQLFSAGGKVRQHCHMFTKDGQCRKVLKSSQLVRDERGEVIASVENVTDISDLVAAEQRIVQLQERLQDTSDFCGMVGRSPAMRRVFELTEKAAQSDATVIIYGESGVGKELVAHAIHRLGPRRDRPFVQINCAAFNESLLESELFGHVRGAFTGAHRHRIGRFEEVGEGDLFLDEVGDIPLPTQVKLLRVLETRAFERVGDNQPLPMDARLISATNQDLERLVAENRFRRDFFFRINVIPLRVPPLRERREDIPLLVDHFVGLLRERTGRGVTGLTPQAMARLVAHPWLGNVRELRSALEYAFVVCTDGPIDLEHLPPLDLNSGPAATSDLDRPGPAARTLAGLSPAEQTQRDQLIAALQESGGNKSAAARILGVSRMTVLNRMRKYGIDLQRILLT